MPYTQSKNLDQSYRKLTRLKILNIVDLKLELSINLVSMILVVHKHPQSKNDDAIIVSEVFRDALQFLNKPELNFLTDTLVHTSRFSPKKTSFCTLFPKNSSF